MIQRPFYRIAQRILSSLLIALPVLLLSHGSLADDDERWFQVEVIIFARGNGDSGEENWPRNPTLSYPFHWVELRDPLRRSNRFRYLAMRCEEAPRQNLRGYEIRIRVHGGANGCLPGCFECGARDRVLGG